MEQEQAGLRAQHVAHVADPRNVAMDDRVLTSDGGDQHVTDGRVLLRR